MKPPTIRSSHPLQRLLASPRSLWLSVAVLLCGLTATAWITHTQQQELLTAQRQHFDIHVAHLVTEARRRLGQPLERLVSARAGLAAAQAAAGTAGRRPIVEDMRVFLSARDFARGTAGLLGVGLVESDGNVDHPRFRLRLAEPQHSAAAYLAEADDGSEYGTDPVRREAILRALGSGGDAVLSGALQFGPAGKRVSGFLLLVPVYGNASTQSEPPVAPLRALLVAALSAEQLFAQVVDVADRRLDFEVFDGADTGATLIYDHDHHLRPGAVETQYADRLFSTRSALQIGGRQLTLRTSTTPEFEAAFASATPSITGAAGTALTLLSAMLVALLANVRERAAAREQALTEDLELMAMVAKHTSNAVIVTDARQRIRWVNEGFERLSGYRSDEALGRVPGELLRPRAQDPAIVARLRQALGAGEPLRSEMAARAKDGHEYWIDNDIQPLRDARGVLTGFMAVHTDITAAHLATLALAQERERLALVLAGANAGTWDWTLSDSEPTVDDRFATLLGRDAASIQAAMRSGGGLALVHPDDRAAANAALRSHLQGETPAYDLEMRLQHRDGHWRWLHVRGRITARGADGRPQRVSGTVTDVTDKREAARRWRARAEMSGDWFWVTDTEHRFSEVFAAQAQRQLIGGGSLIGLRRDAVPFVDPPEEGWDAFHARLDRHEPFNGISYRTHFEPTNPRWLELDGRPHFDDTGRFVGYEGVGRDITERRRVMQDLRDSLALFDSLFEAIPTPVVIKDVQGRYLRTNRALAELYGIDPSTLSGPSPLAGRRNQELQDATTAAIHQRMDEQLLAHPGRAVYEVRQHLMGGREFDSLIHKATLLDGDGRVTGLVSVTIDITEQKRQEHALRDARDAAEAANRAKSAFLATMSHEIRTPMNGVVAMAELLALSALDADQAQTVDTIRQSALALLRILDDILDFSKIEAGRLELEQAPLAVAPLVQGVCAALTGVASARGVQLQWQVDAEVPTHVLGDATRLRQLLNNLVGNAVKFSSGLAYRGEVSVHVRLDAPGLSFVIRDNGIGIDTATLTRLFTPFTQAEVSTTRRFGGTGLGLAISRRLVDLMGGRIEVESRPGEGATFIARLPLAACAAPPQPVAAPSQAATRQPPASARILVAEDDPVNRIVIKRQLELLGHAPEVADNGRRALALWNDDARPRFALVITDLHMPEMDGYSLVAAIRQHERDARRPPVPILALTANAMEGEAQRARLAGMDDYLTKPLALAQLKAALENWLGR